MEKTCRIKLDLNGILIEMEGDKEFIENNLLTITKLLKEDLLQTKNQLGLINNKLEDNQEEQQATTKKITLTEFCQQKKPKSAQDAALLIAYYLYKYEGQEEFTAEDLRNRWNETKVKPPKNISQTVIDCARKKRWFERTSARKYKITEHGIYDVENLFPKK